MTPLPARVLFGLCATWLVGHELRVLLTDSDGGFLFDRAAHVVVIALAGLLCVAAIPRATGSERIAFGVIAAGVLAWAFGETYYTAVLWDDASPPLPSPADAGFLLFPPLLLAGIALLQRRRARHLPGTMWADGVTAALGVAAVCAALLFHDDLDYDAGSWLSTATGLAYPLFDLVLLATIVGVLAGAGWQVERRWILLGLGVLSFSLADSLYVVAVNQGTYESGGWYDAGWWTGLLLIAAALWQPESAMRPRRDAMRLIAVPLAFGSVGLGVLVAGALGDVNTPAVALAALSVAAVMVRLMLTFRENVAMLRASRDEALTDALTGLGNRRALAAVLEEEMRTADDADPIVLVLFDLDGFKHYNDTFGHPAGDALLVRLGANLSSYFAGRGKAFRMGGDEFCAVFRPGREVAEPIITGAAAALSERGEGFAVGCSWGSIMLPREVGETREALRLADQRMYVQKNGARSSAGRQSAAVLLRAIAERNPALSSHLDGVAALAAATARRLALPDEEVERVRHAAELHDVGKVAIPDAILSKPGPLDAGELAFIRRHPLIGERIVGAAPALGRVAALVRATHERWDGGGYPDGLGGQDIPLGARIVAVCDAFDAMTSERPHSAALTREQAVGELRRCAGSQFDPVVVEAFSAVCSPGAGVAAARA